MRPTFHLLFALALCAAVLAGFDVWYSAIANKSAAVVDLQNQIDEKTAAVNRVATTRATFAEMAGDEAVVQAYFVPETGVVSFINGLEDRGRAQGATVGVLSVSTDRSTSRPTLAFVLSIKGTFDAVMRTVGAIEYAPYDVTVSALTVGQDAKDGWHADLRLTVGSVLASATTTTP